MLPASKYQGPVLQLYKMAERLKKTLDSPDILQGRKLYDALESQSASVEASYRVADSLESEYPDVHAMATRMLNGVMMELAEVEQGESPDSDQWKREALANIKPRVERFLATRPALGGKRRKTRKGKSRRARYSRRR